MIDKYTLILLTRKIQFYKHIVLYYHYIRSNTTWRSQTRRWKVIKHMIVEAPQLKKTKNTEMQQKKKPIEK